jgi:hypothetical protein
VWVIKLYKNKLNNNNNKNKINKKGEIQGRINDGGGGDRFITV